MPARDEFAGSDQKYLREVQYGNAAKLSSRAHLHVKYRTGPEAWFPWLARQVDWPSCGDVLEVGCGPGWMWAEAADDLPPGLRLTLTDLSPGMVAAASARVGALERFAAVRAEALDAQRLPFLDGSFDVVVANHMLYHVPDPISAIAEMARVLRPSGCLLAAANGPVNMRELWEVRSEIFGLEPTQESTHSFGSVSGLPVLRAEFAKVRWRTYVDELRCTDADDIVAYLTSGPPGENASAKALAALKRAVQARFERHDGVFTITKDTGAFVASEHRGRR